jgi:DNA gyrase subunit A
MSISQISEQGRATQGVKLIKLDDEDEIAAITNLDEEKAVETDENPKSESNDTTEPNNP